jgi:hypothetical protein
MPGISRRRGGCQGQFFLLSQDAAKSSKYILGFSKLRHVRCHGKAESIPDSGLWISTVTISCFVSLANYLSSELQLQTRDYPCFTRLL